MRNYFLFACLLLTIQGWGQSLIRVIHASGKVYYYAPGQQTSADVYPGMSISSAGQIRCDQDGSVKLLCKGKVFEFQDVQTHNLQELDQMADGSAQLNFIGRFWQFLYNAMDGSEDDKKLEEQHQQAMEGTHAGVKGYSKSEFKIKAPALYDGKLGNGEVEFKWSPLDTTAYCFKLMRQSDDAVIAKIWTRTHSIRLDMAQLALEQGVEYIWQVVEDDQPRAPHSGKISFTYSPDAAARALQTLTAQIGYKNAQPVEQQLMEAYALEEAGFYYDAYVRYDQMTAQNLGNKLVSRAYAAFLARVDMMQEAKKMIRQ